MSVGRVPCPEVFCIQGTSPRSIEEENDVPNIPPGRGPPPADRDYPTGLAENQPDQADSLCSGLGPYALARALAHSGLLADQCLRRSMRWADASLSGLSSTDFRAFSIASCFFPAFS